MKVDKVAPLEPVDLRTLPSFRAENFPVTSDVPWLDRPDWRERIDAALQGGEITPEEADLCRKWAKGGYIIIEGMFDAAETDAAWAAYERAIDAGDLVLQADRGVEVQGPRTGRVLNPHMRLDAFRRMLEAPKALEVVSLLLGAQALPFQTIAGHIGSEQKAHSDSIHMTTYPQGFLVANWIAFEDIHPNSGPLEFYPGSHRLDYLYSHDCGITLDEGQEGYAAYHAKYEPAVQRAVGESRLQPHYFLARKGDVLFWHANLLHGGSAILDASLSRHALVCHYFAKGCVCYHDYTGRPSHLTKLPEPTTGPLPRGEFDAEAYLRVNPDVRQAGVDAYTHYLQFGRAEGRRLR